MMPNSTRDIPRQCCQRYSRRLVVEESTVAASMCVPGPMRLCRNLSQRCDGRKCWHNKFMMAPSFHAYSHVGAFGVLWTLPAKGPCSSALHHPGCPLRLSSGSAPRTVSSKIPSILYAATFSRHAVVGRSVFPKYPRPYRRHSNDCVPSADALIEAGM